MVALGRHLYKMKDSVTNIMRKAGRSPGLRFDSTSRPAASQNLDFRLPSGVQNPREFFPIGEMSGQRRINHLRAPCLHSTGKLLP
jgi:hypothetical protein